MKYKTGNKVRIKSLEWYNENKDENGCVNPPRGFYVDFNQDMSKYCGKVCIISDCLRGGAYYRIKEDGAKYYWYDWMLDETYKEEVEKKEIEETSDDGLNLCEILKGCEGTKIYCALTGEYVEVVEVKDDSHYRPITVKDSNNELWSYPKEGYKFDDYPNGDCMLFPSKECRDWDKFEKPIPVDTPMLVSNMEDLDFRLRFYEGYNKGKHFIYSDGHISTDYEEGVVPTLEWWDIMIPFDKFNPNDIEESLKYNIQK